MIESQINTLTNSHFTNLGSSSIKQGGAMLMINSNATIHNVEFINNTAVEGGAVYYSCLGAYDCELDISYSTMKSNHATTSGGAIKYDMFCPVKMENHYENNTALYGPDIASYPVKIKIVDSNTDSIMFTNVGSGIMSDVVFTLGLYDNDDQIMNLDSSSSIQISLIDRDTSDIDGTLIVKTTNGEALFDEITFSSLPGTTNVQYKLDSLGLNKDILRRYYGSNYTQNNIVVDFRFCQPGEIQENSI